MYRVVLKRFLACFGCVLRFIVLLKDAPSPQFEVKRALKWVFTQDASVHWCIDLFQQKRHHVSAATRLHFKNCYRSGDTSTRFFPKPIWSHQTRKCVFVLHGLLANSRLAVMCLLLRRAFRLTTLQYSFAGIESLQKNAGPLIVYIRLLVTSLMKALPPRS